MLSPVLDKFGTGYRFKIALPLSYILRYEQRLVQGFGASTFLGAHTHTHQKNCKEDCQRSQLGGAFRAFEKY